MDQTLINWALSAVSAAIGFFGHLIWMAVRDIQKAQSRLQTRLSEVEVLVAGSYVKRQEFERFVDRIIDKLDSIDSKLDNKVDK